VGPGWRIGRAPAAPVYRIGFRTILDRLTAQLDPTTRPPDTDQPADQPGSTRSTRPTRPGGTPRPARRPAPRPVARPVRSIEQLRAELHAAIDATRIDPQPSAEAIRRLLACAPARARQLRDEHAHHERAHHHTDSAATPAASSDLHGSRR